MVKKVKKVKKCKCVCKPKPKTKKRKGFTLVELLVVIAIIGILAAVGVTALGGARAKARDAKRVADIKQIQSALEMYYNDIASYPVEVAAVKLGITPDIVLCSGVDNDGFVATAATCDDVPATLITYMGLVPKDPQPGTGNVCTSASTEACNYGFISAAGTPASYKIWFRLEGPTGGFTVGNVCATQNGMKNGAADSDCP